MGCREKNICSMLNGGQDWIKPDCDSNQTPIQVSYDKAGTRGMDVGSNKSIVGVGNRGVLLGKGLRLKKGAKNVIIQNIHIDVSTVYPIVMEAQVLTCCQNLNPQYVWGGDAIDLTGDNNGVWIDHCKASFWILTTLTEYQLTCVQSSLALAVRCLSLSKYRATLRDELERASS